MKSIIAARLKEARIAKGLTQIDVMKLTNIHNKTLSGYENEVSEPDYDSLNKLADLYGVSIAYLLGREATAERSEVNDVIAHAEKMNLNEEQKTALEDYKKMPLDEQQRRLNIALEQIKNLSAADQEALFRIINSLSSR